MAMRTRFLFVLSCLLVLLIGWRLWSVAFPTPRVRTLAPHPGGTINREKVELFDLKFHGVPFGSAVHELRVGEEFVRAGDVRGPPDRLPSPGTIYMLNVYWRPLGTSELEWVKKDPRRGIVALGNADPFKLKCMVDPRKFQPGDYEMRAYLKIYDPEGEDDSVDCLARGELCVLP